MKRGIRFVIQLGMMVLFTTAALGQAGGIAIKDVTADQGINLAGEWRYRVVAAVTDQLVSPKYRDAGWKTTNAPASWTEQGINFDDSAAPLVLYRRTIQIPSTWKGQKIGISCWFSRNSALYLNGVKVEPRGPLYARFADVSKRLKYGQENLLAVTAMYEGNLEINAALPPRIGPLGKRIVPEVVNEDLLISGERGAKIDAAIFRPAGKTGCPALIMLATVHHDSVIKEVWADIGEDLARSGYFCLALQTDLQEPNIIRTLDYLCGRPEVDAHKIGIIGVSMAGNVCLASADHDSRFKTAIILSGPKINPDEVKLELPFLLIASANDSRGPLAFYAEKAAATLGKPGRALILPDKEHGTEFFDTKWNTVRRAILDWLTKYLP